MATYLAGQGPLPSAVPALPLTWVVTARAEAASGSALGRATAQECAVHLSATPTASLMATGEAELATDSLVEPLIRSGLAAHCFRFVPDPQHVASLWATTPLPALLLTSPLLPYLSTSPEWDQAELDPDEKQLLDEVSQRCTQYALDLLTGRSAVPASTAPPPCLLDLRVPDRNDRHFTTTAAPDELTAHLVDLHHFRTTSRHTTLFEVLDQRGATETDQQPPVATLSLGIALVARIAAQGDRDARRTEQHMRHVWLDIARHAPDLVAGDIALAEFLVNRAHNH